MFTPDKSILLTKIRKNAKNKSTFIETVLNLNNEYLTECQKSR